MVISRKWLIRGLVGVVALFVIAFPLGDKQHGIGKHHAFIATVGQAVFTAFLVGFVLLIAAAVIAAVQHIWARTHRHTHQSA